MDQTSVTQPLLTQEQLEQKLLEQQKEVQQHVEQAQVELEKYLLQQQQRTTIVVANIPAVTECLESVEVSAVLEPAYLLYNIRNN